MSIHIAPQGDDRFVAVDHRSWNAAWRFQFPEDVRCREGAIMAWPGNCRPRWEQLGQESWAYTWRTTPEYVREVVAMNHRDSAGNPQYPEFFIGCALRAEIAAEPGRLRFSLTVANESDGLLHAVTSEGGCWQARSQAFMDADETSRSYARVKGQMLSMARLPRSVPERCRYYCDLAEHDAQGEWFWGRSEAVIDVPAVVGAVSRDGARALVLGYENARSGWQNSDGHHCLHSAPFFGDIAPGRSVTRRGWVLFGRNIDALAERLIPRLAPGGGRP